ncbi:MAG: SET domain-containing protein [Blastocatellia bacterium]
MNEKFAVCPCATGLGLFALEKIPPEQRLIEYTGERIAVAAAVQSESQFLMHLNKTYYLDGADEANLARYINHSCQPNSAAYTTGRHVWIWSEKEIQPGEEITLDYGEEYFNAFIKPIGCKCRVCNQKREKQAGKNLKRKRKTVRGA